MRDSFWSFFNQENRYLGYIKVQLGKRDFATLLSL
jgi:hypothetical protein